MPRFQIECTLSGYGYLELEAPDAESARKKVQQLEVGFDFGFCPDVDTTLFDMGADIRVDNVVEDTAEATE